MKKIAHYIIMAVMLFALQGCSNEIEEEEELPTCGTEIIDPKSLLGEWYITEIKAYNFYSVLEINETFHYDKRGALIGGDNASDALKIKVYDYFSYPGYYDILIVGYERWNPSDQCWESFGEENITFGGANVLAGEKLGVVHISRFNQTTMRTSQEWEGGTLNKTYTKL